MNHIEFMYDKILSEGPGVSGGVVLNFHYLLFYISLHVSLKIIIKLQDLQRSKYQSNSHKKSLNALIDLASLDLELFERFLLREKQHTF